VLQGVRLTVAYDGTDFAGWQAQRAQRTVQDELERAIRTMAKHESRVRGAGRTDAGVHALGQVAAFDTERAIPPDGWRDGLNALLPGDAVVRDAAACAPGYEPRFDALDKTYRYTLHVAHAPNPLVRRTAWHVPRRWRLRETDPARALDLDAMRDAARRLEGTHDFRAFRAADDERLATTRTLFEVAVLDRFEGDPERVAIEVRGTAFLKQMVRILVGTLVEIGSGRRAAQDIDTLLREDATRALAGPTAPPHGLVLVRVTLGRKSADAPTPTL